MNRIWRPTLLQDNDLDELVELCQLQPGKAAAVTAEYINWQRNANPAGQAQVGVAKDLATGKILGLVWFMPFNIQVGNEVVLGSQSLYALVHPDYRGQGIFTGLVPFCYDSIQSLGVEFSYGLPNPKSYPLFIKRLGWTRIGDARLWLRPLNINRLITRRLSHGVFKSIIATLSHTAVKLYLTPKPIGSQSNRLTITEVSPLDPLLDDFWQRIRGKYPVMLVRDTTFLDWRYAQIPDRDYQLLAAKYRGKITAMIILRQVEIQGITCGLIVDFLAESTSLGRTAGERLVREAIGIFGNNDLDLVGCMMLPGAEEINLLVRQGLTLCPMWLQPQPIPVILKGDTHSPRWGMLSKISSWFLTMSDHDVA